MPTKSPVPDWLQVVSAYGTAFGAVFAALGVLAALWAAFYWEPKKARQDRSERDRQAAEDRRRYDDQMAALQRAENDRIAAQARKVVPSVNRADMFGENLWMVRVNNLSNGAVSLLDVRVVAFDTDGNEVESGCRQANNEVQIGQGIERIIVDSLSGGISGALQSDPMQMLNQMLGQTGIGRTSPNLTNMNRQQIDRYLTQKLGPEFSEQIREAMAGELATEWMSTLTPNQNTVMAFKAESADYTLRVYVQFEDEAGYRWERNDNSQPRKIDV